MAEMQPGQGAQIAAQSLFTASAAVNAIPVAGQFASAGLALAGVLTKVFGGRRKKKKAEEKRRQEEQRERAKQSFQDASQTRATTSPPVMGQPPIGATAPVSPPPVPKYSTYNGGQAPTVQNVLNNSLGMK